MFFWGILFIVIIFSSCTRNPCNQYREVLYDYLKLDISGEETEVLYCNREEAVPDYYFEFQISISDKEMPLIIKQIENSKLYMCEAKGDSLLKIIKQYKAIGCWRKTSTGYYFDQFYIEGQITSMIFDTDDYAFSSNLDLNSKTLTFEYYDL